MSVLENLKEKLKNIDEQIAFNEEIIEIIKDKKLPRKIIKNKKRDIENLKRIREETILSYEEDLKKEIQGKIYEDEYRISFISDINRIDWFGFLWGNSLDINFRSYDFGQVLFNKNNGIILHISRIKNEINDPAIIYDRIENEILKAFEYFLLSVKKHHNLIFINKLDNGDNYDCILDENLIYQNGNIIKFYGLSIDPERGIISGLPLYGPRDGKQIKRVKASDIDTNQVFYDFYKRSVEFCKDMLNRMISKNQ